VIVALTLVAVFAMAVLTVDVGALFLQRRALVAAADAAALAAAQSCARRQGVDEANVQADFYAVANAPGSAVTAGYPVYSPNCQAPAGTVTVRVEADQELFFAPALGLPGEGPVSAQATAAWGGAGVGTNVAPLMISADRLHDCDIPPPADAPPLYPVPCSFWWDNSPASADDPALSNAEWGTLDLLNWDILPPVHCNNSTPPQFEEWMLEGFFAPLPIDSDYYGGIEGDGNTYVCRGQGNFGAALDNDIRDAMVPPLDLYFPVNDPTGQIDVNGDPCVPPDLLPDPSTYEGCSVDKYDIIGFAKMQITGLYRGNRPEARTYCGHIELFEPDANARCMTTMWVGWTTEGLNPQGGENFGLVPVRLVE
jgi:hypothetical protein